MKSIYQCLLIVLFLSTTQNLQAEETRKAGLNIGVGYDLDGGITAQYKGYRLFFNSDALAIDKRLENFVNDSRTLHVYVDAGAFVENYDGNNANQDDRVGLRLPIGLTFGLSNDFQAYIQAVPNYDFNNDDDGFNVDGAVGIRFRF